MERIQLASDDLQIAIDQLKGIEPIKGKAKKENGKVKITLTIAQVEIEVSNVL